MTLWYSPFLPVNSMPRFNVLMTPIAFRIKYVHSIAGNTKLFCFYLCLHYLQIVRITS
jgi:hypothetical protein